MPYMTRLERDLKAWFPRVDAVKGWEKAGSESFNPASVGCHWTAGPRGTTRRASLDVVTLGRPGLTGPLCNVYLDRAGIPVLVAAGRANHAGKGGWRGLVGNSSAYGIEAESAGDGDWTPAQREAYPRLVAAMLAGLGRGAEFAWGHSEWAPDRKIDIRDWTMDKMRRDVAVLLARGPGEDADVALSNEDLDRIAERVWARNLDGWNGQVPAWRRLVGADQGAQVAATRNVAEDILDDEKIAVQHPITGSSEEISIRLAIGRAASVVRDGVKAQAFGSADPATLAAVIKKSLPADLAAQVVRELALQLAK